MKKSLPVMKSTFQAHEQPTDRSDFIRSAAAPSRAEFEHAPVSLTARAGQLVRGQRSEYDARADRVDPGATLPQRTASAISRSAYRSANKTRFPAIA
jgi:hypothetical protein